MVGVVGARPPSVDVPWVTEYQSRRFYFNTFERTTLHRHDVTSAPGKLLIP